MALVWSDPVIDIGVHVAILKNHGASIKQTSLQIHPKGLSWGNPNIILPLQEFDTTCDWLE